MLGGISMGMTNNVYTTEVENMTEKELITIMIDKYTDLQRIKVANGDTVNKELDYQIKVLKNKLAALGIPSEDYEL